MAIIRLHIKKEHLESTEEPKIHSIPCKIHADEAANVSTYFEPYIRRTNDNQLETSFRGYPLAGATYQVPEGYKGVTFFEYKKPDAEDMERNLYSTGIFSRFTYWNYDKIPSKNDALVAALDWIDIAEAINWVAKIEYTVEALTFKGPPRDYL